MAVNVQKITPFLWFDTQAEEAIRFHVSAFAAAPGRAGPSKVVSISRYPAGPVFRFTEAVSMDVDCSSQAEVDYFWTRLSADPKAEQCGWLKDRFGLSWQIVPSVLGKLLNDPDKEKSGRVMQAMLQVKKLDIAALKRAHAGP